MSRPPGGIGTPIRPPAMPQQHAEAPEPRESIRTLRLDRPLPPPAHSDRQAIRAAVRARKRAEAAERRRPGVPRRRRLIAGGAGLGLVLLVGLPLLLAFGPVFPVRTIQVTGVSGAAAGAVRSALGAELGRPVALVSEQDVARALAHVPAVERFSLVRRPPGTLEVAVVPRIPVLQQRTAAGWERLDAAHVVVSVASRQSGSLPVLTIPAGTTDVAGAYATAAAALRALGTSAPRVTAVRASGADDVVLTLEGGPSVQWGGAEQGAAKAEALHAALRRAARGATQIDVSSPGVVLTR